MATSNGSFLDSGINLGFKLGNGLGGSIVGGYRQYFGGATIAREIELGLGMWYF